MPILELKENVQGQSESSITLTYPFQELYFAYDAILGYYTSLRISNPLHRSIRKLITVMDWLFAEVWDEKNRLRKGRKDRLLCKVVGTYSHERPSHNAFILAAEVLRFDGANFTWGTLQLEMPEFSGKKQITDLPFYPLSFEKDPHRMKGEMKRRGQGLLDYLSCTFFPDGSAAFRQVLQLGDLSYIYPLATGYDKTRATGHDNWGKVWFNLISDNDVEPSAPFIMRPEVFETVSFGRTPKTPKEIFRIEEYRKRFPPWQHHYPLVGLYGKPFMPVTGKTYVAENYAMHLQKPILRWRPESTIPTNEMLAGLKYVLRKAKDLNGIDLVTDVENLIAERAHSDKMVLQDIVLLLSHNETVSILSLPPLNDFGNRLLKPYPHQIIEMSHPARTERLRMWTNALSLTPLLPDEDKQRRALTIGEIRHLAQYELDEKDIKQVLYMVATRCHQRHRPLTKVAIVEGIHDARLSRTIRDWASVFPTWAGPGDLPPSSICEAWSSSEITTDSCDWSSTNSGLFGDTEVDDRPPSFSFD
ncbi:Uu.00g145190.m01.CDS01 [Anthostomella pinea]|uniref:Uu.00g145190.m01.CDS01 n=1 Tax=Anthostomella pinea TaxID=933095 RepID=A0AAI8VRW5_9PEZI|nr:Uu.00g145190.m01.CDS01 [Anthostomella pinea]